MADWIVWTSDLTLNHEEIDAQHRELIKRFNDLGDAVWDGRGKEEIFRMVEFVSDYTVFHFGAEETLMKKHDYPGYPAHRKAHEELIAEVVQTKKKLSDEGATSALVISVVSRLGEWTREHIRRMDTDLAKFLHAAGGQTV